MLQRAMSLRPSGEGEGGSPSASLINRMLSGNFAAMQDLGEGAMRPFLQDVLQFSPLLATLVRQVALDPALVPQLLAHVGPAALAEWTRHVAAMGAYTAAHGAARPAVEAAIGLATPRERFRLKRLLEAWEYGAGLDYRP